MNTIVTRTETSSDGSSVVYVDRADDVVWFSQQLLDRRDGLFLSVTGGDIIVTAMNGRWTYRPIGHGPINQQCVVAKLVSHTYFSGPVKDRLLLDVINAAKYLRSQIGVRGALSSVDVDHAADVFDETINRLEKT